MRTRLLNLLKLAIGVGLLAYLYTRLEDPAGLWAQMLAADKAMLLVGILCHATAVALSALKWGYLLRAQQIDVAVTRLLSYQWMAIFFDNFFPAQLGGDILRGYSLARDTHRRADAAASVIIDRFTGLTAFMAAVALVSSAMLLVAPPQPQPANRSEALLLQVVDLNLVRLGSLVGTAILLTILALMLSRRLKRWAERLLTRFPFSEHTQPIWQKLAQAINAYRGQAGAMLVAGAVSLAIVAVTSFNIWLIANAIEPGSISYVQVLVINPISAFLILVPLSPGGLGVRQLAFAALFVLVGARSELGFAVGLLQQVITYLVSLPGLLLWIRGRSQAPAVTPSSSVPADPSVL